MCVVHRSGVSNPSPSLSSIAAISPPSDLGLPRGFGHFCVQLLFDAGARRGRVYTRLSASSFPSLVPVVGESGYLESLGINVRERIVLCLEKFGVGR